ncbi:elongation factor 1-alpha C-terminal domain-related protein, partial [Pseudidiomarina sp.]|uniref:elongation factor 1-alpha C-terminal domain-related protein n=1 Tax=Pseudidiomarina sp. TaxID=2081707 RepID=UPI0029B66F84|nr:sulfate adenylyltransferase subunit CysN [Pseudidiomarina sp.]
EEAAAPLAVTLTLNDEIDISRGDMIVEKDALPHMSNRLRAKVVWMQEEALIPHREYYIKMGTKLTSGSCEKIHHRVDVNTLEEKEADNLGLNEIGVADFSLQEPVVFDKYKVNQKTGAFIIIDRITNVTVGAGMVEQPLVEKEEDKAEVSAFEKEFNALVRKHFPHWGAKEIL